ncbi:glycoside hydrolase 15 protein [Geranomyces michiganensis]|nr:glycoside hydrolase 15 protein [Geranomyces michiganensis]
MQLTSLTLLLFAASASARAVLSPRAASNINPDVSQFLARQVPISEARMLAHINNDGAVVAGAAAPFPAEGDDYQFYWVRDGGLTMAALADLYAATGAADVPTKWDAFYRWTVKTQATARASAPGWFKEKQAWTKYSLDGQPFEAWMSPQYDGPALRASAFIKWAKATKNAGKYYVASDPNSVIKTDLDSIVNSYTFEDGYEPWEEVKGKHFFVHMTQYRALIDGADLAASLGDNAGADKYRGTAQQVRNLLNAYWAGNHIRSTLNGSNGGQNEGALAKVEAGAFVDISSILAVIHASDDATFPANDPKVQATFYEMIRAFTQGAYKPKIALSDWSLNQKDTTFNGKPMNPAVGRYPEDIYDGKEFLYSKSKGAGFWFLATNAMAETLYKAVAANDRAGSITITSENVGFWSFIGLANAKPQTITKGSPAFAQAQLLLVDNADRFIRRTAKYVTPEGYMSEQFQFATGAQQGTQDLAWSYASVVSASLARADALALVGGDVVVPTATATPTSTVPIVTPTAHPDVCPVSDADKKDCGFAGITQSGCEAKGCCWKASTPGSQVPWCFNKLGGNGGGNNNPVGPSCAVALANKKDCGFAGINQSGCEAKGCCWSPLTGAGPWCFVKA